MTCNCAKRAMSSVRMLRPKPPAEKVVEPAGSFVMRISAAARRLQHGRVQSYILYLVLGLVALAILAVMGGSK